MRGQTTADLGKYVARARVNMPHDVPPKKPAIPSAVYPMCESCGVRDRSVCDARVGHVLRAVKALCTPCRREARR